MQTNAKKQLAERGVKAEDLDQLDKLPGPVKQEINWDALLEVVKGQGIGFIQSFIAAFKKQDAEPPAA